MIDFLVSWIANTPGFAAPYALAALGLIVSERAGVLSLGAEGFMLVGAVIGVGMILSFGMPPLPAMVAAMVAAALVSTLFAALVVWLKINQVIAGLVMVFFCQGATSLIGSQYGWTNRPFTGLPKIELGPLANVPVLGPILAAQDVVIYATPAIFLGVVYVLFRTHTGLRLRAVGESPEAADAAGIDVSGVRFLSVMAGASLIGLAGAYISVGSAKIWVEDMTSGRGWIAVALVIFARWSPWRALAGAILFGAIEALVPKLAAAGVRLPQYLMLMTPYLATLGVMIWIAAARRGAAPDEPGALGVPHVREERR
ncbi:ABC transporter permease [Chelatococcus sambhunathii]|uniref:ABC transporter permease n=1 Tax=Chelatococcus sambhunathii TaxID=363953 RepID=UPI0028527708|nr:ABC transporter permease [Chelatococcus sambhunathii]